MHLNKNQIILYLQQQVFLKTNLFNKVVNFCFDLIFFIIHNQIH